MPELKEELTRIYTVPGGYALDFGNKIMIVSASGRVEFKPARERESAHHRAGKQTERFTNLYFAMRAGYEAGIRNVMKVETEPQDNGETANKTVSGAKPPWTIRKP